MILLKIIFDQLNAKVNGIDGKIYRTGLIDKSQFDAGKEKIKRFKILIKKKLILLI